MHYIVPIEVKQKQHITQTCQKLPAKCGNPKSIQQCASHRTAQHVFDINHK